MLLAIAILGTNAAVSAQPTYLEVSAQLGLIPAHNDSNACSGRNIPVESGSAWGDYDNDGDADLFLTNGFGPQRLYRNDGDLNSDGLPDFTEIAQSLGLEDPLVFGHSAVFVDYDNDGDQDLYLTRWGGNVLYQNQLMESGTATFTDVTSFSGLGDAGRAVTTAWGDFDQDGHLDVYLAKHLYCNDNPQNDDRLYRNNGDGTFSNVTGWLCPGGVVPCPEIQGSAFTAGWLDYDNDGDPDLYVANEDPQTISYHNVLWRNDGSDGSGGWLFTDVSNESGAGASLKSMGLGIGDFDNDGFFDLAVSNVGPNLLLRGVGNGFFGDVSETAGIQRTWVIPDQILSITWGTAFFDHDNDRLLDLFYSAGPIGAAGMLQPNAFFRNDGDGTFTDISEESGLGTACRSRNVSTVDIDNDGFVDVFIGQLGYPPLLFHNQGTIQGNSNHWLTITATGSVSNRDAIGTRLSLETDDGVTQIREITSGASYGGGDYRAAFFGLGPHTIADLTVRWPSGETQFFDDVISDQHLQLVEPGAGIPCDEIDFFNAKCNANGAAQAMVRLLNSTTYAGQTIDFDLDGEIHSVTLATNGTHTIGKLQVPLAGFGEHVVSMVNPFGCYDPVAIVCQIDEGDPDEFDRLWSDPYPLEKKVIQTDLYGNFPNPFNPETTIRYSIAEETHVTLRVYNTMGEEVVTLVRGIQSPGEHSVIWDGRSQSGTRVASGLYLYTLTAGNFTRTEKMLILK